MVSSQKKNLLVLGKLGQGKSEILQSLSGYKDRVVFPSSDQPTGHSQHFIETDSLILPNVKLIDSPGTSDRNIPFEAWLNLFETQYAEKFKSLDLVICVFRDNDRLSEEDALFFSVLQQCFVGKLDKTNFAVCFNMTREDPDHEDQEKYVGCLNACIDQLKDNRIPRIEPSQIIMLENLRTKKKKNKWSDSQLSDEICQILQPQIEPILKRQTPQSRTESVKKVDSAKILAAVENTTAAKMAKQQAEKYAKHRKAYEKFVAESKQQQEVAQKERDNWLYNSGGLGKAMVGVSEGIRTGMQATPGGALMAGAITGLMNAIGLH